MSGGTVTVKVLDGWAVYDGQEQRGGGEQVDVDPDTAGRWVAAGWVEPVEKSTTARRGRS